MATATASDLRAKSCKPCEGGVEPLSRDEANRLLSNLDGWQLSEEGSSIVRKWTVNDFQAGIDFFNRVTQIAEAEQHHPDLHLTGYRNVMVELSTHAIGGLSENDFIIAAKIDELPVSVKKPK
jgi:4a-hydroxytetrahydrobiopterin dehydratase